MRRSFMLLLTCAALLWSVYASAVPVLLSAGSPPGNNANPHNLSSRSQNSIEATTETQICVFCHIPHGGTPNTTLWGRPDPNDQGSFPLFAEPSSVQDTSGILGINNPAITPYSHYGDAGDYPNGASKLCLSCHDGITAIGTLVNGKDISVNGGTGTTMQSSGATNKYFGNGGALDLSKSHPISFVYDSEVLTRLNGLPKADLYKLPAAGTLDGSNRVQCTICHDPHISTKHDGYTNPFWRGAGSDSTAEYNAVCNKCHTTTYNGASLPDHQYP